MKDTKSDVVGVKEAAKLLGLHPNTLRDWTNKGHIKFFTLPGRGDRRFFISDLEAIRKTDGS
jgi:excisionase family DNA binding protein